MICYKDHQNNINVMCLYLDLTPKFKQYCDTHGCDKCILARYFSDDTSDLTDVKFNLHEGRILFLAQETSLSKKTCAKYTLAKECSIEHAKYTLTKKRKIN